MRFDERAYRKWERETHIPEAIMNMVNAIAKEVGCGEVQEETISIYNRGGEEIGWVKGFTLTHCTSSIADGPSPDYSDAMAKWLKGLNFKIENSYGDNGMDWSTNHHDTFWTNEFGYKPSEVYEEQFIVWEESDYVE